MRSKGHAFASRARQRLLELCGKPADGAVQVIDTIDAGKVEQGLKAADQTDTCAAADISVIWVPDVAGQLQPYQLLPGISTTCSSHADTSCPHSTDTASWQLQQLHQLQQQQQQTRHNKALQAQEEMQQSQQHKGLQEMLQHDHDRLKSHLDEQPTPKPDPQQPPELQAAAAATAAAQVSAQHRCCKDCGATVALTWHWYNSSSRASSRSRGKHSTSSKPQSYVLCHVCSKHLTTSGCHRRFSGAPTAAVGPAFLAAALAAAAAVTVAAAAADPEADPDSEHLLSAGVTAAVTAVADRKVDPESEQLPAAAVAEPSAAEATAAAGHNTSAQAAALAAADPTAVSDIRQQLAARAAAAAAEVNPAMTAPAEDPTRHSDIKQQTAGQATAAATPRTVQQSHESISGSSTGVRSLTPAGQFSFASCSNCSRSLAVAECRRGGLVHDRPERSQQQQQVQLCDRCQLYWYVAGAARPVSADELSANQAGARQVIAAWQGLQQWQQKLKQQQEEEKEQEERRIRFRGLKRPRSQAAATARPRKRPAGLLKPVPQEVPQPSHKKQQPKQQQQKGTVSTAAAPAAAAVNGKLGSRIPAKTPAAAAASPAQGLAAAQVSKKLGKKQPPKFKELGRNVFVHRQRVQLDSQDIVVCSCRPELGHCCSSEHGCLNHLCKVSCTPGHCPVGDDVCRNMVLFKRQFPSTALVDLGPKGWGMVAAEDILPGSIVAEYTGEVVNVSIGKKRLAQYAAEGLKHTYIMDLSKNEVIDATKKGGTARFINHSCEPNCKTEKWQVGGEVVVAIKATKRIPAGTEITYDYRYQSHDLPHARTRCCCGTASCTGWLGDFDPHEHLQAELDEDEIMEAEKLNDV